MKWFFQLLVTFPNFFSWSIYYFYWYNRGKTLKCLIFSVLGEIKIWQGGQRVFRLGMWQYKEAFSEYKLLTEPQREKIDSAQGRKGANEVEDLHRGSSLKQDLKDDNICIWWRKHSKEKARQEDSDLESPCMRGGAGAGVTALLWRGRPNCSAIRPNPVFHLG